MFHQWKKYFHILFFWSHEITFKWRKKLEKTYFYSLFYNQRGTNRQINGMNKFILHLVLWRLGKHCSLNVTLNDFQINRLQCMCDFFSSFSTIVDFCYSIGANSATWWVPKNLKLHVNVLPFFYSPPPPLFFFSAPSPFSLSF